MRSSVVAILLVTFATAFWNGSGRNSDHSYLNPGTTVDQYGRWQINSAQFPNGIAAVADYVHSLGLKFGIYATPGIPVAAVNQNTPLFRV